MAGAKIDKAEKLLTKSQNSKAEALFRESIELEPSLPEGHLGLGAALVAQERFEEALPVLETAKEKYVAWEQTAAQLDLEQRQATFQEIQEFTTMAGTKNPGAAGQSIRGQAPTNVTKNVAGRLAAQEVLSRDRWSPEELERISPQVYYLQGIANLRLGRRDAGIDALRLCLALAPDHGLSHYNLAVALFGIGHTSEAKEHLDAALAAGVEPHPAFVADLERALD
jgi:tetratricopeptide (TPR) repeat protein